MCSIGICPSTVSFIPIFSIFGELRLYGSYCLRNGSNFSHGLWGKSFILMLIGTGIPGIMASRTIEHEQERRTTIMTTMFIPCGAKLPIIALISGALFGGAWWVVPSAYFLGIAAIIVSGIML